MLSSESRRSPEGFRYVGGMLNIAYLTGFVREPGKHGFMLQQNNNLALSIPVSVQGNTRVPREFSPVTVLCHVYGSAREGDNTRLCELRAIDIKAPSTRSMPTWIAWAGIDGNGKFSAGQGTKSRNLPDGVEADAFEPFSNNGSLKVDVSEQLGVDSDKENEDIVRDIIEATKGHLDTRLGDNANVVMLSGLVEAAAIVRGNEFQADHLGILIRQHEDPTRSIPVRLYSRQLLQHLKSIAVGFPVKIIGQSRVKIVPNEDGKGVKDTLVYIRCNEIKVAERGVDVRLIPDWWRAMKDKLMEKATATSAKQTPADAKPIPTVEGL